MLDGLVFLCTELQIKTKLFKTNPSILFCLLDVFHIGRSEERRLKPAFPLVYSLLQKKKSSTLCSLYKLTFTHGTHLALLSINTHMYYIMYCSIPCYNIRFWFYGNLTSFGSHINDIMIHKVIL